MHPVSRPAGLLVVALAIPLLLGDCKSSEAPSVATTIVITPPAATLAAIGRTQAFTAVVKDQHGNVMASAVVTWGSVNAAVVTVVRHRRGDGGGERHHAGHRDLRLRHPERERHRRAGTPCRSPRSRATRRPARWARR